jgi:hypothetical protein
MTAGQMGDSTATTKCAPPKPEACHDSFSPCRYLRASTLLYLVIYEQKIDHF